MLGIIVAAFLYHVALHAEEGDQDAIGIGHAAPKSQQVHGQSTRWRRQGDAGGNRRG